MTVQGCEIRTLAGLSPTDRADAARLFWAAFRGKLGRLLGPDAQALVLLERAMRPDHALVVVAPGGRVVGVAGFRSPVGSFLALEWRHLRAVYGRFGGVWRSAALHWMGRDVDNARFLVDGLAVAEGWRGRGLGSALIEALAAEARARGYARLRLDVADQNDRARALYERLGFDPAGHQRLGLAAPLFGMSGSTVMERRL
ncbi:MAG: GNAT family N-acetyltransferase [Gemmobacter sp.]|nr:GNAT family N-acetyltransferase [Gemmobacter sp.]